MLGTDTSGSQQDNTSEVEILENQLGPIEAVGIGLTNQSDIDNLDQIEGEARGVDAVDNIFTANELIDTLADLNPLIQLDMVGNDVINGGEGNDIIFGDSMYTDVMAADQGLSTPPGADTVITVFGNGGNTDQVIQLTGFDSTGMSGVQIIENLLTNGNFVVE
ncbi:MAG: type I secretion C-terminal target domain-containing protein [Gammaproteobacteria bacterium]